MTAADFYRGKSVVAVEWYLNAHQDPAYRWARLRVFSDGTADACWEQGTKLYGFDARKYAGFFLNEDEYVRFGNWDAEDEQVYGVRAADLVVPTWVDQPDQEFEYLGVY